MKISQYKLFHYAIPLKSPVQLGQTILQKREGLILQIIDENGQGGFGEIAPLPEFSKESLEEAESEIRRICRAFLGKLWPQEFQKVIEHGFPSVCFGIEASFYDLKAKTRGVRICELLNKSPRRSISVNGLLTGDLDEILKKAFEYEQSGYKAVKLKVGQNDVDYDINMTKQVRKAIGEKVLLRLDANRSWNFEDAQKFCKSVAECNIEYLEEPLADFKSLVPILNKGALAVPIALDETTREILPEELTKFERVKAIVLKPTLLGLEKSLQFASQAHFQEITPVMGSSFESGLGLSTIVHMAAAFNTEDIPAGLDTYSWFADDIIKNSLPVKNGQINIDDLPEFETVLQSRLLKEVNTL